MSRIGKKPISIPDGVDVKVNGRCVVVSGKLGTLEQQSPEGIVVELDTGEKAVRVKRDCDSKRHRTMHGLMRALTANMIEGVSKGYEKRLEIYGTGYGCDVVQGKLHLNVGFMGRGTKTTPQFALEIPKGLDVQVDVKAARGDIEPARFVVRGVDKQLVGQFAADVHKIRPSEPYKGKGIRYQGEQIRRKQGKAFARGAQ